MSLPTLRGTNCPSLTQGAEFLQRPLVGLGGSVGEQVLAKKLPSVRRREHGKRLFGGGNFSRHRAGGILVILDRKKRRSIGSIEEIHKTLFRRLRHRVNVFAIALHREQHGRGGKIPVPDIMTDCLKMPDPLPRLRLQRDQAIGEQIIADPVSAVKIRHGRAGWNVNNSPTGIDGHAGPIVGSAGGLPCVPRPGVVPKLPGVRDGMKRPAQFSGSHIKGSNIPRRRWRGFGIPAADDEQILINDPWAGEIDRLRSGRPASQVLAQIDSPVASEAGDGTARGRVERINKVHHANQDPFVLALGPVGESAVRLGPFDA